MEKETPLIPVISGEHDSTKGSLPFRPSKDSKAKLRGDDSFTLQDGTLAEQYGIDQDSQLWETFNEHPDRFDLENVLLYKAIGASWCAATSWYALDSDQDFNEKDFPPLDVLKDAKLIVVASLVNISIEKTIRFRCWLQSRPVGRASNYIEMPSLYARRKAAEKKEKEATRECQDGEEEHTINHGGEKDGANVREAPRKYGDEPSWIKRLGINWPSLSDDEDEPIINHGGEENEAMVRGVIREDQGGEEEHTINHGGEMDDAKVHSEVRETTRKYGDEPSWIKRLGINWPEL